jgi:alkylation response protein AidB-like acyl-CoA dehydrogenase
MLGGSRRDPWQAFLGSIPSLDDPLTRQEVAALYCDTEVKEMTAFRAQLRRMRGDQPGPEGSFSKVFNAELNQRRTSFAVRAAGMHGIAWAPGDRTGADSRAQAFLRARANTIEGGTSEVLRNQVAERVLGLPREPDQVL